MMDTSLLGFDSLDSFASHHSSNGFRGAETTQTCSKKYSEEWFSLFERRDIARWLKEKALRLELADCRFRSICWKIFLECLPDSRSDWIIATRAMRHKYEKLMAKACRNPRMEVEEQLDLAHNNPLSQDEKSPWNQYFEDSELRIMIKQDVIRTFPEIEFFQTSDVQEMMVNILFHYARQHPQISYRQGMHELLAPIIFVLHNDQQAFLHALELDYIREFPDALRDDIRELLNPDYTEHDAFFLFNQVMDAVESWYSWNENYIKIDQFSFMPFAKTTTLGLHNGLGVKLCRINQSMLKAHDLAIYTHLENMEIPLHVFGIRWLRLLFGREFVLPELLILWDAIFADSLAFNLVDYIFVAMLICIRKPLLNSDYAKCLSYLMKYPAGRNVTYILQLALHLKDPKKYPRPGEQDFDVYNPGLVTKMSGRSVLSTEAPRCFGRPVGRPNTLGIQVPSTSSEPTSTLESGSEVSDEESVALRQQQRGLPKLSGSQVWSFRGIKKNASPSSGSRGDKEMVQLNSSVVMRQGGSMEEGGSELPLRHDLETQGECHHHVAACPSEEVHQLHRQLCHMQQVMDWCCTQMSTHLALLQESVLSQKLQREDEVMLAIARLKRVRDTLKGTVECNDVGQEEAEGWTLLSSEPSSSLVEDISWGDSQEKAREAKKKLFKALVHNHKPTSTAADGMAPLS